MIKRAILHEMDEYL
jgi:hypothetical protein